MASKSAAPMDSRGAALERLVESAAPSLPPWLPGTSLPRTFSDSEESCSCSHTRPPSRFRSGAQERSRASFWLRKAPLLQLLPTTTLDSQETPRHRFSTTPSLAPKSASPAHFLFYDKRFFAERRSRAPSTPTSTSSRLLSDERFLRTALPLFVAAPVPPMSACPSTAFPPRPLPKYNPQGSQERRSHLSSPKDASFAASSEYYPRLQQAPSPRLLFSVTHSWRSEERLRRALPQRRFLSYDKRCSVKSRSRALSYPSST
ncbi:hypothetical protein QR680_004356 [Steinernema hermaphroditum]|uniref:Uncharacterized protein n=1 Tax=Steinernema hermaphroditum TaxID=289476 RepID=A0AA39LTV7_9BILA|nr:hypothetical protein QR680_004356 [Steinernema hermaphroditum]